MDSRFLFWITLSLLELNVNSDYLLVRTNGDFREKGGGVLKLNNRLEEIRRRSQISLAGRFKEHFHRGSSEEMIRPEKNFERNFPEMFYRRRPPVYINRRRPVRNYNFGSFKRIKSQNNFKQQNNWNERRRFKWADQYLEYPPQMSERKYFSNEFRPQMSERKYFSNEFRPQMSKRKYFSNKFRPQMSERKYFLNKFLPQMSERKYFSNEFRPQMSKRKYFTNEFEYPFFEQRFPPSFPFKRRRPVKYGIYKPREENVREENFMSKWPSLIEEESYRERFKQRKVPEMQMQNVVKKHRNHIDIIDDSDEELDEDLDEDFIEDSYDDDGMETIEMKREDVAEYSDEEDDDVGDEEEHCKKWFP